MEIKSVVHHFLNRFKAAFNQEISLMFKRFTFHWLLWIMPILIFIMISSIFSNGVLYDLPVGYVDQDKSSLSREIIRDLNAGAHAKLIDYGDSLNYAEKSLARAKIYSLLYIPSRFESDVLSGKQPTPIFYYNALYYSAGLYSIMDYSSLIADINTKYRNKFITKMSASMPKLVNATLNYDGLFNPSGNAMYYQQFSATVHLLQIFVVVMTIHLLSKFSMRTLPCYSSVLGKLAPYTLWYVSLLIFEISILVFFSKARISGNPFIMLLIIFFYVIAAQSIGVLIFSFTRSIINAYSYIGLLVGLALTYSGIVIPEISMPKIAQFISSVEPLTYALNSLFDLFIRQASTFSIIKTCLTLLIYPIVATFLVRKRLIKRLKIKESI